MTSTPFLDAHNDDPRPFIWTKTADRFLESLKRCCAKATGRRKPSAIKDLRGTTADGRREDRPGLRADLAVVILPARI
jgi:hypothetical protein